MGFSTNTSVSSTSNSLTMPYTTNFNGLQSFNIHLSNISTKNIDSINKSISNIIQSIPMMLIRLLYPLSKMQILILLSTKKLLMI
jgi:hypothetical protein